LGAHLAEMDKLLRDIQVGLVPGRDPAPPLVAPSLPVPDPESPVAVIPDPESPVAAIPDPESPVAAIPEPAPAATASVPPVPDPPQLEALTELSTRLLSSIRELLAGYERVLVPSASPQPAARRTPRHRPDSPDVTLAAGPFASLEALRDFEQAVSRLPGVREVAIRGYEGTDRAIIEVRLDQPNP
jgi:hypothetical protein